MSFKKDEAKNKETNNDTNINNEVFDEIENYDNFEDFPILDDDKNSDNNDTEFEDSIKKNISLNSEINNLKEALARKQADYDNFQKRVDRDKADMLFFLKADILKKTIPWLDNIERIIKNTPENMQNGAIFEGILAIEKLIKNDLEKMGVTAFKSIGSDIDPNKHEVMTQIPGESGKIVDEFEKGYMLGDKVLRIAKVIAGI